MSFEARLGLLKSRTGDAFVGRLLDDGARARAHSVGATCLAARRPASEGGSLTRNRLRGALGLANLAGSPLTMGAGGSDRELVDVKVAAARLAGGGRFGGDVLAAGTVLAMVDRRLADSGRAVLASLALV